jgi:hypothetical protein
VGRGRAAARPRNVGNQHHRADQVLHGFGQVAGRLQRVDHVQQGVGVLQVVAVEV